MNKERMVSAASGYRGFLPYFLRVFLPLTFFLFAATATYYVIDTRHEKKLIRAGQLRQVESSLQSLQRDVSGVIRELKYLASSDSLKRLITTSDPQAHVSAVEDVATFAHHMGRYDQIRWLDLSGMERLRVEHRNGTTRVIPQQQLQDKSSRYYFTEAIAMLPGEIYVSPLDLNVEHEEVELPHRPMLRFSTPTADASGERNGLLVLNYQASQMLDNFARSHQSEQSELSLLNTGGYWLFASDHQHEWGFMFARDERFQNFYSTVWESIKAKSHGTLQSENGLFTFATIDPLMLAGDYSVTEAASRESNQSMEQHQAERWIVVSRYPLQAINTLYLDHLGLYGAMMGLALLVLFVSSWKMARATCERNRLMDELALHAKVMETAANGVIITDAAPEIMAVNQAFTELTGYSREEVLGKDPTMLASGRNDAAYYDSMWQSLKEQGYWEGEIWNRHKNGEVFPEWLTISAVHNHEGVLTNYIAIFSVLSEQKSTEVRLRELANSDPLTGLLNRNLLYDRGGQAIAQSRRNHTKAAVLFLDLDGFKPINDSLGHAAGDMVLKGVADRLKGCVRESDTVARFGGDEFVVLLTGLKENVEAAEVAEKIIHSINQTLHIAGTECHVGASIGISIYPDDGDGVEELVKHADQAMYRVKENGKGKFDFFRTE